MFQWLTIFPILCVEHNFIENFRKLVIVNAFQVKGLSFSIDGMYIASVGEDRAVCMHHLSNQKSVVKLAENNWPTTQVTIVISASSF